MWQLLSRTPEAKAAYTDDALDLLQANMRSIIFTFGGLYLVVLAAFMTQWPSRFSWLLMPTAMLVGLTCFLAYKLIRRRFVWSQIIWQIGMATAIVHSAVNFQRSEILFLLVFLPMMAVITVGWQAGVVSEVFVWGLVVVMARLHLPFSIPAGYEVEIGVGGLLGGLLGWAATNALFTIMGWSLFSYRQAEQNLAEARQHQGHLASVMKDLDNAYYRLERANAALVAAWRKADEAERVKAEFVVNVSHELRTPLNLIIGFSEVISRSPESYRGETLPSAYRRDMNAIYNSARHLLAMIDDVLDLGRIDTGKIALARDEVAPLLLVTEVVDMVRDYIHAKGLDLHVHVEDPLPKLWIDSLRIRQTLLNLLVNAARFTTHGYIRLEVVLKEAEVVFRVTDTGQGIAPQDLPHVFELFHTTNQPPANDQWHSGTGLGLPISKRFVELHGGQMGVESAYGQGATLWFTLPYAPHPSGPAGDALASLQPGYLAPPPSERIVVVVNEDTTAATLLQRYLDGFRVMSATGLSEGLALAEDVKAIALITEPGQPVPHQPGQLPLVSFPWPSSRQVAAALGAKEFITKPVSRQQLFAAVDRLGCPVRRILIADHNPELVRLFQRMLRVRVPIQNCLEAYNRDEVIQRTLAERPDLVIMELSILQSAGETDIQRITDIPALRDMPVIIVSERSWEDLSLRLAGAIQVQRAGGFELSEIVNAAGALFNVLARGWNRAPAPSPDPPG